ncbi:MAG: cytochrome c maturation protein CcmE [Bacteroidota bacterium]
MNKTYIIAALMLVFGVVLLANALNETDPYATFDSAALEGGKKKIAGQLMKDKPMIQDQENPDHFSFYLRDTEGKERQVVLLQPKPQDFELSEQIVLTGRMEGDQFIATDVQLKCPSKYKDEESMLEDLMEG